jgi:FKBP-type peptidyl-prolyl cis-trans isomerase
MRILVAILAAVIAATACSDPVRPSNTACSQFMLSYGTVGTDTMTASLGVQYVDVAVGTGDPLVNGNVARVNYSLYDRAGTFYQSSCSVNQGDFIVILGSDGAIPAFQAGVIGMRAGGIRRVIIPAAQGYPGDPTLGGKDLVFDIELYEILR